jgi:hypothetical protein
MLKRLVQQRLCASRIVRLQVHGRHGFEQLAIASREFDRSVACGKRLRPPPQIHEDLRAFEVQRRMFTVSVERTRYDVERSHEVGACFFDLARQQRCRCPLVCATQSQTNNFCLLQSAMSEQLARDLNISIND